mgnify:CR=1 FL=1
MVPTTVGAIAVTTALNGGAGGAEPAMFSCISAPAPPISRTAQQSSWKRCLAVPDHASTQLLNAVEHTITVDHFGHLDCALGAPFPLVLSVL